MTPPQHPPRPGIHLAPPPRSTDVERMPWTLDALGSAVTTVAGKVESLTVSVDKEDDGIKVSLVAIRCAQAEQAEATAALRDNIAAIGMSLADLQAALILRDVAAEERAKSTAIEASKASETRGLKTAAAGMTGLGGVLWAVLELLKLFHIGG